ncbi:hypothetical protein OGAPHI_007049 [Ogataea philodendri]|uniref:Uncharacterized protein n=1 Tax=Ogataea philodendri TaxID=1378263 RepID=A0A9P8NV59_9ASCO|nr:uncharacterized protein OGAPHI_007049 [Ogataea philodendri]KAH3660463.1 hypothetical protein OGAPHI_007049 [Ogataea philodendri]
MPDGYFTEQGFDFDLEQSRSSADLAQNLEPLSASPTRTRRSFSISKFLTSKDSRTHASNKSIFTTAKGSRVKAPEKPDAPGWYKSWRSLNTLFRTKKKSKPDQNVGTNKTEHYEHDSASSEQELSCYNAYKSEDLQISLSSLRSLVDPELLQKTTARVVHDKTIVVDKSDVKVKKRILQQTNNGSTEHASIHLRGSKIPFDQACLDSQIKLKKMDTDQNLITDGSTLDCECAHLEDSSPKGERLIPQEISFRGQKLINCAPEIYLNSDLIGLFDTLKLKTEQQDSKFYVAEDQGSLNFPDFEIQSQISNGDVNENSFDENTTNGPLSSFVEDQPRKGLSIAEVDTLELPYSAQDKPLSSFGK